MNKNYTQITGMMKKTIYKLVILTVIVTFSVTSAFSQTNAYQITSTTGGFVAPAMTTGQRTGFGTPTEGSIVYDNTVHGYYYYDNVGWKQFNNATFFTGILPIANGGTNIGTLGAAGSVEYSNGTQIASTAVGTAGQVLTSAGAGTPIFAAMGALLNIQVFSAAGSGTYTPTAGTSRIYFRMVGGGGAGGGTGATAGTYYAGGGGGAGGYCEGIITVVAASYPYTVGAGGVGGTGTGGNGGSTTLGAALYTANGGNGAITGASSGGGTGALSNGTGATGGTASGGTLNLTGGSGGTGRAFGANYSTLGGAGAGSIFGTGGFAAFNMYYSSAIAITGQSAVSPGSGGGGAINCSAALNANGGNGAPGIIIIYEYK